MSRIEYLGPPPVRISDEPPPPMPLDWGVESRQTLIRQPIDPVELLVQERILRHYTAQIGPIVAAVVVLGFLVRWFHGLPS